MKLFVALSISILVLVSDSFAQNYNGSILPTDQNEISGGLGITWITDNGGEPVPYYSIGVLPDLSFGKIGVGLDFTLLVSSKDGTIRKVDWSNGAYRRIIRYIRWGQKHDPVYAQVGQLYAATLGYGLIVDNYDNSPSYDDRRIGGEFDVDLSKFGFETMYGDFQRPGVMGGRLYLRPLKFTNLADFPVLGGLELGATFVTDQNSNSGVIGATYNQTTQRDSVFKDKGEIAEFGLDAGFPVLRSPFVDLDAYYAFAQFKHFGHGSALGVMGTFRGLGLATASVKIERQFIGNQFIPEYFDQFYELTRFTPNDSIISKASQLENMKSSAGWYGQVTVSLMQNFKILGGYRGIDHDPIGGLLNLETRFPNVIPMIVFNAGYDRWGVRGIKDLFRLDNRSLLYVFVGYEPYPFMTVGLNYYWTFIPENGTYVVQRRVSPGVMLNFTF
ncbi:MAG: hypothetical protein M1469_07355 [Bacteroidetes bacterium]|nr:hypothetical protein [Bacteroidota bacterium]MCL5267902.1 hypothetical protein [Bacteroidota bacterium]